MAQTGPPPVCKAPLGARCRPRVSLAADGYVRRTFLDAVTTGPRWLDEPLAADAGDAGCGLAFEQLGRYAGAQLSGQERRRASGEWPRACVAAGPATKTSRSCSSRLRLRSHRDRDRPFASARLGPGMRSLEPLPARALQPGRCRRSEVGRVGA